MNREEADGNLFDEDTELKEFLSYDLTQNIEKVDNDTGLGMCHEWQKSLDRDGYGRFSWKKAGQSIKQKTHVYAALQKAELYRLPTDTVVRHLCSNRKCCNPDHLLIGSIESNMLDAQLDGSHRTRRRKPLIRYWQDRLAAYNAIQESSERGYQAQLQVCRDYKIDIAYLRLIIQLIEDLDEFPDLEDEESK